MSFYCWQEEIAVSTKQNFGSAKIEKRQYLPKERLRRKDRIESSLFIFDELLGATYPSKMFIGNENAYVCIWQKSASFPLDITVVNQSKWPIKCQSLSCTNQRFVKCNFIYPGRVSIGTFGRSLLLSCSLNGNSSLQEKRPVIPLTNLTCIQKQQETFSVISVNGS